ncbi:MAG: hypothetical protein ABSC48_03455 [Terracidiphilus sp.]|jgi:hypothetical protein
MGKGAEGQVSSSGTTNKPSNLLRTPPGNIYGGLETVHNDRVHWTKHWLFWFIIWSLAAIFSTIIAFVYRSNGFNKCVWNALFVFVPLSAGGFVIAFRSIVHEKEGYYHFFDPKHNVSQNLKRENGEFGPHSQRYNEVAKLILALSAGVIAFFINALANSNAQSEVLKAIRSMAPIIIGFFGFSIALIIIFMALQAFWYEEYCHTENHNSYNRWKYAICVTLGWTGLVSFGVGVIWLAANLF